MVRRRGERLRTYVLSPITWRILAVNLLALVFLFAGMLFLDEYRRGLIRAELATLTSEAQLFAAALGESATSSEPSGGDVLITPIAQQIVRRLVEATGVRARLFAVGGDLVADSLMLLGPGGSVQINPLPPPPTVKSRFKSVVSAYDRILSALWQRAPLPMYEEPKVQRAGNYDEVSRALTGQTASMVRQLPDDGLVLSVAVPVQRYSQVAGALMLSEGSAAIDAAVLKIRLDVLRWFLLALAVTVLLSLYLANTIARPLLRLAAAAERVRSDRQRQPAIPDFGNRQDEIGQLAVALHEMTTALWARMDAIEGFAADVAHEIKNPLTSLRSAVETVARVNDPERRARLLAIINEDVGRMDRLITDISEASRVDAEISRAPVEPVDVGKMISTLAEVTATAAAERGVRIELDVEAGQKLIVPGREGRLVQVFRNLLVNALSFSPANGRVLLAAHRRGRCVVAEVTDEGPGIPEGQEAKIFKRFYSERPTSEQFGNHSGLGLSIARQIVEAHRGVIEGGNVKDDAGRILGARFVVSLPAL